MNRILDDYVVPGITALIGLFVGLATWKFGASPGEAIVAGVGVDLVLLAHLVLRRISELEHTIGCTRGVSAMIESIECINDLSKTENPWLQYALKQEIGRFRGSLSSLRDNRLMLSPDTFMGYAETLYSTLGKGDLLRATSIFGGGDYWNKVFGQRYARLNKEAAARGAEICRVFIPRNAEHNEQLTSIYSEQIQYCKVLVASEADVREIGGELRDFLVLGEKLAIEFNFSPDMTFVRSMTICFNREEIKKLVEIMDRIFSVATEFQPNRI